ncbi:MAG: biotin--[acetyl-CoA-carboxylase] ligase [Bacillota bacterium]
MGGHYERIHFESTESTNNYVKQHHATLSDHTLVTTGFQSKGRGQRDRNWTSAPGLNFMGSFYKKTNTVRTHTPMMQGVLTVVKHLDSLGIRAEIKPPNDVYVSGKKIAGILAEVIHNNEKHTIIGIGYNVNEPKEAPATSLLNLTGRMHDLETLTENMTHFMETVETLDFSSLYESYKARIPFEHIRVSDGTKRLGKLETIDSDFQCVVAGETFPCERMTFHYE